MPEVPELDLSLDAEDPPVSYREFDDQDALRTALYGNVLQAAQLKYPIENDRYRLELNDLAYDEQDAPDLERQKRALLSRRSVYKRLRGTWRLVDKATEQAVDERNEIVAHVPHITERGTIVHNGGEYSMASQMRLRPGPYARRKANGELEVHFNLLPGTGKAFRVHMDPATGVFKMKLGQGTVPLYSILSTAGVSDKAMREAWGDDLFAVNRQKHDVAAAMKAAHYFTGKTDVEDAQVALQEQFARMRTDPDVTQRSMGKYLATPSAGTVG